MTAPVFDVFTPFQVQLIIIRETDDADYGAAIARLLKALDGDVLRRLSRQESTLCKEIIQLKRVPAEKALGPGFFQRRFAKSRGSTPEQRDRWRERIYDEIQEVMPLQAD